MLCNSDASGLHVSLGEADSLVLVTKLGNKACVDIALKESGIDVNIPGELTTFVERIHMPFLCLEEDDFILSRND